MNDYDLIIKCRKYVIDTIKSITKLEVNPLTTNIEEQLLHDIKFNIPQIKIIRKSMFVLKYIRHNHTDYDKILKYVNDDTLIKTYIIIAVGKNCNKTFMELTNDEKYNVILEIYHDYVQFLQNYVMVLFPTWAYIDVKKYDNIMGDGYYGLNKQLIYIFDNYNKN
jgi:hypothetical protein